MVQPTEGGASGNEVKAESWPQAQHNARSLPTSACGFSPWEGVFEGEGGCMVVVSISF